MSFSQVLLHNDWSFLEVKVDKEKELLALEREVIAQMEVIEQKHMDLVPIGKTGNENFAEEEEEEEEEEEDNDDEESGESHEDDDEEELLDLEAAEEQEGF